MSFTLDLTPCGIKAIYCGTIPHAKPFLQIIRLQKIESFQTQLNSERYKLLLSDGLAYMQAVLSPKLNHLIYLKQINNYTVIKLVEYDIHEIKGVKLVVISNMEDITNLPGLIGSPVSIEKFMSTGGENGMTLDELESTKAQESLVNSLSTDFLHLFNNPQLSDVTFVLKDKQKLYAHKNILCTRSSYFQSLFLNGMKETYQTEIEVNAWDSEVFSAIIRFIYSDQIQFGQDTQVDRVWSLFMAARYYQLDRLLRFCEQFLISEKLSVNSVCLLWNTSVDLDAQQVTSTCRKYFEEHFEEIIEAEEFVYLNKELLLQSLKSDDLIVSNQDHVSQAILKWARAQMSSGSNVTKQELFCTFFPLLRTKRKINGTQNAEEVKKTILDATLAFGAKGVRVTYIAERVKFSPEELRHAIQLLHQEGSIFTLDGQHWIHHSHQSKDKTDAQKKGFFQSLGFGAK